MSNFKEISPKELKDNAFSLIGDEWMLVSAANNAKVNTMTASWGGLGFMWKKDVAFIVIRPQRYTKEFIDNSDTLTLSFFDESYKKVLSYLGTVSGRDEDKISKSELTVVNADSTPYFEEARLVLECKKLFAQPMTEESFIDKDIINAWYPNSDYHTLYVVEITKALIK